MVFDERGNLFVSTGDYRADEIRIKAQDLNTSTGKILHPPLVRKPVPADLFVQKAGSLPEIYAYGLRNTEGMAINPAAGEISEAEFGPHSVDEINVISLRKNLRLAGYYLRHRIREVKVGDGITQREE